MKRKICTNMRYLIRFHRNIYYERSNIRYLVSNRHILLIFKLNISVSIISKKKKDFTGGRVKTVIHRGRYILPIVHALIASKHRWAQPMHAIFHVSTRGIRERERGDTGVI